MDLPSEVRLAGAVLGHRRYICAYFNSKNEEYDIVLPFLRDAIRKGQKSINIVSTEYRSEHLRWLEEASINTAKAEASGQFEVHGWDDAYFKGGQFDQHAMLVLVEETLTVGTGRPAEG